MEIADRSRHLPGIPLFHSELLCIEFLRWYSRIVPKCAYGDGCRDECCRGGVYIRDAVAQASKSWGQHEKLRLMNEDGE